MTEKQQQELKYVCPKDKNLQYTRTECEQNCDDFIDCPYFETEFSGTSPNEPITKAPVKTNESTERQYAVLELLGFTYSKEGKGDRWRITKDAVKIARDFTEKNPEGRFWAKQGEQFLDDEAIKQIPIVQQFYTFRDSNKPIPATMLLGTISGKSLSEKAIVIEIDDEYEPDKKIWFGLGAVKRNSLGSQGYNPKIAENERYIPAGFTRATDKQKAKLAIPRSIVLCDYEKQLAAAQVVQGGNGHHSEEPREDIPEAQVSRGPVTIAEELANRIPLGGTPASKFMRVCLREGVSCVEDIFAVYHLSDAEKADFALRIAQSHFIDEGKNRRTSR